MIEKKLWIQALLNPPKEVKLTGDTPPTYVRYQELFDHLSKEHGLTLTESELQEIVSIVLAIT